MKVMLAVDGSDCSHAAVKEAASIPWPSGSVVKIVSVAEVPMLSAAWVVPMPGGSPAAWDRIIDDRSIANASQAMAQFGEIAGSRTEVTTRVLKGNPKEAILDEADRWGAQLLIVGTHGYSALERFWLGSVSRTITAHSKCSVHIARRRKAEAEIRTGLRILLAVDGSDCGDAALEEVAGRPWPGATEVYILSAIHPPFAPTPEPWALPEGYYSQLEASARGQAESAVERALTRLRVSNAERATPLILTGGAIAGHPEETIIHAARTWDADLVVLGSHGYGGLERFLLGSVSHAVASHAPCSVEIVRTPQQDDGEAS